MIKIDDMHNGPTGRSPEQVQMLKRVFQGMEVLDAKANIIINAKAEDFEGAHPNDLENCVFARACHRLYDSTTMVFMATLAYVDLPDENGNRKVYRFQLGEKFKAAIKEYDESKGAKFSPGVYTLLAMPICKTLDRQRERGIKRTASQADKLKKRTYEKRRRAKIKSTAYKVKTKNRAYRRGIVGVVRSGSGLVQTQIVRSCA
jgi:hypothetical protein